MRTRTFPRIWILLGLVLGVACTTAPEGLSDGGPVITTRVLDQAREGALYGQGLSLEGGEAPYVWSVIDPGPYGEWLEIETGVGMLRGTPTSQKSASPITVSVADARSRSSMRTLELGVGPCADGLERRCAVPDGQSCKVGKAVCRDGSFGSCEDLDFPKTQTEACGSDCKPCDAGADRCVEGQCQCGIGGARCGPGLACCPDADNSNASGRRCANLETDVEACGNCNLPCRRDLQHTARSCAFGQCQYNCEPGWKRCNADPANLNCGTHTDVDLSNCGSCGNVCGGPVLHGVPGCAGGKCEPQCEAGWASCGSPYNFGCQVDLMNRADNCGSCGNSCGDKRGVFMADCIGGRCANPLCRTHFADCNGNADDGCEFYMPDCESKPHVSNTACGGGTCQIVSCVGGYRDCNHDWVDGCESFSSYCGDEI